MLADNGGDMGAQLPTSIEYAQVQAALGKNAEAMKLLEQAIEQARKAHVLPYELETRLALGEVEMNSGDAAGDKVLADLERDARANGFLLIVRNAAAERQSASPNSGQPYDNQHWRCRELISSAIVAQSITKKWRVIQKGRVAWLRIPEPIESLGWEMGIEPQPKRKQTT